MTQNRNAIEMKKPSALSDLLNRVKNNTNNDNKLALDESTATSRIQVTNTINSDSQASDNLNSISKMRRSRRLRQQVDI